MWKKAHEMRQVGIGKTVRSPRFRGSLWTCRYSIRWPAWGLAWEGGLAITGEQHPRWVEGASAILYHDTSHAPAMAAKQGVRAADLLAHGIVDNVIPEYPDAAAEPEPFCLRVGATLRDELAALVNADTPRRPPNACNDSTGSANPTPSWHKLASDHVQRPTSTGGRLVCGMSASRSEPNDGSSTYYRCRP
jgi:hypothetical protein